MNSFLVQREVNASAPTLSYVSGAAGTSPSRPPNLAVKHSTAVISLSTKKEFYFSSLRRDYGLDYIKLSKIINSLFTHFQAFFSAQIDD